MYFKMCISILFPNLLSKTEVFIQGRPAEILPEKKTITLYIRISIYTQDPINTQSTDSRKVFER